MLNFILWFVRVSARFTFANDGGGFFPTKKATLSKGFKNYRKLSKVARNMLHAIHTDTLNNYIINIYNFIFTLL